TGEVLLRKKLPNKLLLRKITVPLGVVGAIYESRPNVTFDIAALCLRSRNVALLKGSTDAWHTNQEAIRLIKLALVAANINPDAVTLLPPDREVVDEMLKATQHIDVIIPRGSDGLIQYVRKNSLVPVIETGAGVCHVYVHTKADLQKAVDIVLNAKTSRPSVCNAMDTVIVDRAIAKKFLRKLGLAFAKAEVKLLADPEAFDLLAGYPQLNKARPEDFSREFLSLTAAVKIVDDFEAALQHIQHYSTRHSEAIVTENKTIATQFLQLVDAAAVYVNASTRFTDGAVFGLGAEIGISTQKLHARGPFALEKLVTEKWLVTGNGQTR
nr:glutamate-5-semialdehyde dehydrogenase [Flavihumibacter sp.]